MYTPRSSQPTSKGNAKPEGFGTALPNNPEDLLKLLQKQHKRNMSKAIKHTDIMGRAEKQERQREDYERRLMEFEDYVFKTEGADRLDRYFEILRMETEDEFSMQIEQVERQKKVIDFKDQVRLKVEARKAAELEEREEKQRAAVARRQAVVERLRKKAEEEERRRLEAEAALAHIEEEKAREEQLAVDRLLWDREGMGFEEELSREEETLFRELLEAQLYERQEKEKLLEWERQQQLKDEEEKERRKERMAVLEEKKKKLAELQRLQQSSGSGEASKSMSDAREEAAKLNKQLRIQNRAKFVTKKIQKGEPVSAPAGADSAVAEAGGALAAAGPTDASGTNPMSDPAEPSDEAAGVSATSTAADTPYAGAVAAPVQAKELPRYQVEFNSLLDGLSDDGELKALQKKLMVEKRELRLEQRQRMSQQQGQQGTDAVADAKQLRQQISEVAFKEEEVIKKLDKLMQAQNVAKSEVMGSVKFAGGLTQGPVIDAPYTPAIADTTSTSGAAAAPYEAAVLAPPAASQAQSLFPRADLLLRESTQLLRWLQENNGGEVELLSMSFANSFAIGKTEDAANISNRITLVIMEISSVVKEIDQDFDPSNYAEKLTQMSKLLKEGTAAAAAQAATGPPPGIPRAVQGTLQTASSDGVAAHQKSKQREERGSEEERKRLQSQSTSAIQQTPREESKESAETAQTATAAKEDVREETPKILESPHGAGEAEEKSETAEIAEKVEKLAEGEVDVEVVEVEEEGEDEGEEGPNFEDIPGWQECLTTTMASAAHHAAFYGYDEVLATLCQYFDCCSCVDLKGRGPLFYAALQNRLSCVAQLVALDAQWLDVGDSSGDTPLHAAAIANGIEVLSFLLSCEANPDTANYAGLTPCHLARTPDALSALYQAGAQPYCVDSKSRLPLWFAASEGRSDCLNFLCSVTPAQYLLWPDDEGETCLHKAAASGHAEAVETLCQWLQGVEDLYCVNKKQHTAAHVAANAAVLKALYENGANLFVTDPKLRMPLFMASFMGRADCVAFLLDVAVTASSGSKKSSKSGKEGEGDYPAQVSHQDISGDCALHAACLCGHLQCVSLLLYYTRSVKNRGGLGAGDLALRAGHERIAELVKHIEQQKDAGFTAKDVFGCSFSDLCAVTLYYGSRFTKNYDSNFCTCYYLDRCTGSSQWERPEAYDESPAQEKSTDKAREVLLKFYGMYNPERILTINEILFAYRDKYTELFVSLANKYNVKDLSMFAGVELD